MHPPCCPVVIPTGGKYSIRNDIVIAGPSVLDYTLFDLENGAYDCIFHAQQTGKWKVRNLRYGYRVLVCYKPIIFLLQLVHNALLVFHVC